MYAVSGAPTSKPVSRSEIIGSLTRSPPFRVGPRSGPAGAAERGFQDPCRKPLGSLLQSVLDFQKTAPVNNYAWSCIVPKSRGWASGLGCKAPTRPCVAPLPLNPTYPDTTTPTGHTKTSNQPKSENNNPRIREQYMTAYYLSSGGAGQIGHVLLPLL